MIERLLFMALFGTLTVVLVAGLVADGIVVETFVTGLSELIEAPIAAILEGIADVVREVIA